MTLWIILAQVVAEAGPVNFIDRVMLSDFC